MANKALKKRSKSDKKKRTPVTENLEPRILLSADVLKV